MAEKEQLLYLERGYSFILKQRKYLFFVSCFLQGNVFVFLPRTHIWKSYLYTLEQDDIPWHYISHTFFLMKNYFRSHLSIMEKNVENI